jgi:hypothetical protein
VPMDSARGAIPCRMAGCPIRRSSDQCSVPAPRCFSQLPTSFVGTQRQGIHRMPVLPSSSVPRLAKIHPDLDRLTHPSRGRQASFFASTKQGGTLIRWGTRRVVSGVVKVHNTISLRETDQVLAQGRPRQAFEYTEAGPASAKRRSHPSACRDPNACGDAGSRTPYLLRAKQALFQLSYIPNAVCWWGILDSNQGPQSYQDCALTT